MPRSPRRNALIALISALLVGGGAGAVWYGTHPPLPAGVEGVEVGELSAGDLSQARKSARFAKSLLRMAPSSVRIQSVRMEARWVPVKRPVGGDLVIPGDTGTAGLWDAGAPLENSRGTSLLVGHISVRGNREGAFAALPQVKLGATILTSTRQGTVQAWVVERIDTVPKSSPPAVPLTGPRRLALVTCVGPLVRDESGKLTHRDNVVVWGVPANGE